MGLHYTEFFTEEEVDTYRRVKAGSMKLGMVAREVAAEIVDGRLGDGRRSNKDFIRTKKGLFALVPASNSVNTTERASIHHMGAEIVVMEDDEAMEAWFARHGLYGFVPRFHRMVRMRLRREI